jgi:rhodanese-related sulfurtransferase
MASLLLYRASTLVAAGLLAGAVHSVVYSKAHGPITLRLKDESPAAPPPVAPPEGGNPAEPKASNGDKPAPTPKVDNVHITLEQAKAMYDAKVPFVDSRHLADYEAGHVDNAFRLDSDDFLAGSGAEVLGYLDKGKPFVVYCSGGACDASENLVMLMQQAGYTQPKIMTDGFPGWQKAGYPSATGKPLVGGGG